MSHDGQILMLKSLYGILITDSGAVLSRSLFPRLHGYLDLRFTICMVLYQTFPIPVARLNQNKGFSIHILYIIVK